MTIVLNQLSPGLAMLLSGLGVAVTGQIYEVAIPVHLKKVDGPRPTWCRTDSGQAFSPQEAVEQARLSYVGPANKCHLRQPVAGKIPCRHGRAHEFHCLDLQEVRSQATTSLGEQRHLVANDLGLLGKGPSEQSLPVLPDPMGHHLDVH